MVGRNGRIKLTKLGQRTDPLQCVQLRFAELTLLVASLACKSFPRRCRISEGFVLGDHILPAIKAFRISFVASRYETFDWNRSRS